MDNFSGYECCQCGMRSLAPRRYGRDFYCENCYQLQRKEEEAKAKDKLIDDFVIFLNANVITLDAYDRAIIKNKAEEYKRRFADSERRIKSNGKDCS